MCFFLNKGLPFKHESEIGPETLFIDRTGSPDQERCVNILTLQKPPLGEVDTFCRIHIRRKTYHFYFLTKVPPM